LKSTKKLILAAGISGSIVAGGALGVTMFGPMAAGADSPASTPASATQVVAPAEAPGAVVAPDVTGTATPGVDNSNSDATHEAAETPAHEAAETAGTAGGGGGPGGNHPSNKDPAHEATESPARAAAEATHDAAVGSGTTSTATG
jgi:hypothetical protein